MRFVAIDVETANADMASICAVGVAAFEQGRLLSEWYSLIDPEDHFDPISVSVHGIDDSGVSGAPIYKAVSGTIERLLYDGTVVTHTHFDRVAVHQAAHRWALEPPRCVWLDSARVARAAHLELLRFFGPVVGPAARPVYSGASQGGAVPKVSAK